MKVKLLAEAYDPWQEVTEYQQSLHSLKGKFGATAVFVGTMRDFNEGDDVNGMFLEHYPGMTEKELAKIADEALLQWPVLDYLIVHRVGEIYPNDSIVLTAVWTSHRGDAFDANRYIMEGLKSRAPFWKKELLKSGQQRWVEKNTDGYLPADST